MVTNISSVIEPFQFRPHCISGTGFVKYLAGGYLAGGIVESSNPPEGGTRGTFTLPGDALEEVLVAECTMGFDPAVFDPQPRPADVISLGDYGYVATTVTLNEY